MGMTLRWSQDHVYIFLSQLTALLHLWSQHTEGGLPTANGHFSPRSLYTACQALPTPQLSSLLHVHPGAAAPNPPSYHVLSIFLISQTFQYIPISFLSPKTNAAWIFADPSNLAPCAPGIRPAMPWGPVLSFPTSPLSCVLGVSGRL